MSSKTVPSHPPRGLGRILVRLPIWLFRARLGWLLGEHFLLLTHTGRKSGCPRQTVLEVIRHDPVSDTYFVVSAWGEKSDWFRNIQKNPEVIINVGRRRLEATAVRLPPEEAERELLDYARRHPAALRILTRLVGYGVDATEAGYRALARMVPVVALRPRTTSSSSSA